MAMLYLLLELCSILVETFGRVPQPKEAIVGRPLKWTQSGCLLPHCRSKSFGGWNNYFQVDSRRSSGLQAHHDVGFHCTHCVPAMSSVKQLAAWNSSCKARLSPGAFLSVNLTACSTWSTASLCSPSKTLWGQAKETSCGTCMAPPSSPIKHGAILLAQLAGNHASRAETPLTRSTPCREWGCMVTTTFTGPLGARSRFTSALSLAAPISSERIGRNQNVAYSRHSVFGVARDSARRVSEQMYCASVSASRSVKLRAACANTSSTVSIASVSPAPSGPTRGLALR